MKITNILLIIALIIMAIAGVFNHLTIRNYETLLYGDTDTGVEFMTPDSTIWEFENPKLSITFYLEGMDTDSGYSLDSNGIWIPTHENMISYEEWLKINTPRQPKGSI